MDTKTQARLMIQKLYGDSRNFVTPKVLRYGKINKNVAYELSKGNFMNKDMFGVSVVSSRRKLYDKSKSFFSKNQAESYINELKNKMVKADKFV